MKAKAIVVNEIGGPEVLQFVEVEVPAPGAGEVLLRHRAIGLNFVEIYFRSGVYPAPSMPFTPGSEAAGVVEAIGPGVTELKPGDRVAYAGGPMGAYSEARVMPARFLVKLPAAIDEATAAAAMLKGMTAHALIFSVYAIKPGDSILVQAAAGGVGLILCQWAKHLGATVIGAVGSDEKARLAAAHGCDHTIIIHARGYRGAGQGNHWRCDAPGGLRFGRPGNLHEVH
jgi:NADPH:quinone reductase